MARPSVSEMAKIEEKAKEYGRLARITEGEVALAHAREAKKLYQSLRDSGGVAALGKFSRPVREALEFVVRLKQELPIVEESSTLHGNTFKRWTGPPDPSTFENIKDQLYVDPAVFALSETQRGMLDDWKRPQTLYPPRLNLMEPEHGSDLVQDVTTDCSVVASLSASMKLLLTGKKPILSEMMFPYDHSAGRPLLSANGKYVFKMHFNGCRREVVIDDRLPCSSTDRSLFVIDRHNPTLIWPALVEKAYLKIRGGYDFPGSNSGTDLFVLTGWIPEQVFLDSVDLHIEECWEKIKFSHDQRNVVVTLGTGRLSDTEEEAMGLVGEHDYAVLALDSSTGERKLLVKNPLKDGTIWKGAGATGSSKNPDRHPDHTLSTGSFWITFEDIVQNFKSMYLNWNPALFPCRQDAHFKWTIDEHTSLSSYFTSPQYYITAPSTATNEPVEVWVLLSRHFRDDEFQTPSAASSSEVSNKLGFLSLYAFHDSHGHRIDLNDFPAHRCTFVDSPQILAKLTLSPSTSGPATTTVVIVQDRLPLLSYKFSLTILSKSPRIDLDLAKHRLPVQRPIIEGSWTSRSSGGSSFFASYFLNPQFTLKLSRPTHLSIYLQSNTNNAEIPVHIDLLWAPKGNPRVVTLCRRDCVSSSGTYRRGSAILNTTAPVQVGLYTIVVSTFQPGYRADFTLHISSETEHTLVQPIASDGAGRLVANTPRLVFREGERKKRARFTVERLTKAVVVARCLFKNGAIPGSGAGQSGGGMRVSLDLGKGPDAKELAVSGEGGFGYVDSGLYGVRTPEIDLDPATHNPVGVWVTIEFMGQHVEEQEVNVQMLVECKVDVGAWELVEDCV